MKKLLPLITVFCAMCVCLSACSDNGKKIANEINKETTLQLGFLEDVADKDLSSLVPEYGWFGADAYYNTGYEEGDEHYVRYIITAYPDYSDDNKVVTRIECTDPNVKFFGDNTISNCNALFDYLTGQGFEVVIADTDSPESPNTITTAKKGNISICHYLNKSIMFYYEVENRYGIVF